MGIHEVDRASLLVGALLEGVDYARSDGVEAIDSWDSHDLAEMVVLHAGGLDHTIWVSEDSVDTVAIAGPITEVLLRQPPALPAAHRSPWSTVVGSRILGVRTATTAEGEPEPRASPDRLVQAVELLFVTGSVTIAGFRPSLIFRTTWFDELVVLAGGLEQLGDLPSRIVTSH